MSRLRAAQLGPIVGHTSSQSARIWIRGGSGKESADSFPEHRTVGIVAITEINGRRQRKHRVYYFRLRREFDRTGTFTLGEERCLKARNNDVEPLLPATDYVIRVGTLAIDDPYPDSDSLSHEELARRLPDPAVWLDDLERLPAEESEARFRTFADSSSATHDGALSFILGSCRYPGLLWKAKHSDAIFAPLLQEGLGREDRSRIDMLLMVGDQIYADMLNRHIPLGLADTFEEFQERYHTAFGSKHMRRLLRHFPTYMTLDDHEIEDNWTQDRITKAKSRRVFNLAIDAYRSYQWVHGPTCFGQRLFYNYECNGSPFFVLDTRTQRYMDDVHDSLNDNHLLGRPSLAEEEPSQLDLLLRWLQASQETYGDAPKFIVSSSVFAPSPINARTGRAGSEANKVKWAEASDSWPAFPTTKKAILRTIIDHNIQNVIFLSGDIHCTNVAEIQFSGNPAAEALRAFSITSSAFYWPFPFADGDPSGFVHDSQAEGQEDSFTFDTNSGPCVMDYKAWNFCQDDNFCRVDLNPSNHTITVRPFGKDGEILETGGWFGFGGRSVVSELQLAAW